MQNRGKIGSEWRRDAMRELVAMLSLFSDEQLGMIEELVAGILPGERTWVQADPVIIGDDRYILIGE